MTAFFGTAEYKKKLQVKKLTQANSSRENKSNFALTPSGTRWLIYVMTMKYEKQIQFRSELSEKSSLDELLKRSHNFGEGNTVVIHILRAH